MQLYKTVDEDNLIRIEDDEGAAITVSITGTAALILSLIVPKSDRREGVGTALVEAVSDTLLTRGIKRLGVDYPDSIDGFPEFLASAGFSQISSVPILSVNIRDLFSKSVVKRTILSELDGVNYVSLGDLGSDQLKDLFDLFIRMHLNIGNADVARFYYDASGVVYDENGRLEAFVLCSLDEDESQVHVDFLGGRGKGKPQFTLGAVRGMMRGLLEAGGERVFDTLTLVAANPAVNEILGRILNSQKNPQKTGNVIYAQKIIKEVNLEEEVEEAPDEDMDDEWKREIRHIPLQANIELKMPWIRHSYSEVSGVNEADFEEELSDEDEEAEGFQFEKDVDETEGLEYDDTVRITEGNLEQYQDCLDQVSASDMPRYYYRGLVALTDGVPHGVLVYELKNYEDEEDTEAEIKYLSIKDKEAGRRLLDEFRNEAVNDYVTREYFELTELSDLEKEVLKASGFLIKDGEGSDIVLTLKELKKNPVLSKKPKSYVQSIGALTKRQLQLGINNCLFYNRKGNLEDLGFLPGEWFEPDISSCVVSDGRITGLFLTHQRGDNRLSVDLIYAAGIEYRSDILYMMRHSLSEALKKYPADTEVIMRRHSKETRALTKKLFPGYSGRKVFAGERDGE